MTISAPQQIHADESIPVEVELHAKGDWLALAAHPRFSTSLADANGEEVLRSRTIAVCGTPMVAGWWIYPAASAITLLDVTDRFNRLQVLRQGETLHISTELRAGDGQLSACSINGRQVQHYGEMPTERLPAGVYTLRAELINRDFPPQHSIIGFCPDPLGYRRYPHPVVAQTEIEILPVAAKVAAHQHAIAPRQ